MERVVSERLTYNDGGILGKGTVGYVFSATLDGQVPAAVKRIPNVPEGVLSPRKAEALKRDEEIIRQLDHPNVVKILHIDQDMTFRYFALELCAGSLDQCFLSSNDAKKYKGPMPNENAVLYQLAVGLHYIHSKGLLHREIKPERVLISSSQPVSVKWSILASAGPASRGNRSSSSSLTNGIKGTQFWMAPEVLKLNQQHDGGQDISYSVHSDTFSLGLVFFTFITNGLHLFGSKNFITANIISGKPVNLNKMDTDHFAHEIISSVTKMVPEKRMQLTELVDRLKSRLPHTEL